MYNKYMHVFYAGVDGEVINVPAEEESQNTEASVKPKTRREHFLDKIGGGTGIPGVNPKTREEMFLNNVAENGSGAKVLELYVDPSSEELVAYRDLELTEEFASEEEASAALKSAIAIKVNFIMDGSIALTLFPIMCSRARVVAFDLKTGSGLEILLAIAGES